MKLRDYNSSQRLGCSNMKILERIRRTIDDKRRLILTTDMMEMLASKEVTLTLYENKIIIERKENAYDKKN